MLFVELRNRHESTNKSNQMIKKLKIMSLFFSSSSFSNQKFVWGPFSCGARLSLWFSFHFKVCFLLFTLFALVFRLAVRWIVTSSFFFCFVFSSFSINLFMCYGCLFRTCLAYLTLHDVECRRAKKRWKNKFACRHVKCVSQHIFGLYVCVWCATWLNTQSKYLYNIWLIEMWQIIFLPFILIQKMAVFFLLCCLSIVSKIWLHCIRNRNHVAKKWISHFQFTTATINLMEKKPRKQSIRMRFNHGNNNNNRMC